MAAASFAFVSCSSLLPSSAVRSRLQETKNNIIWSSHYFRRTSRRSVSFGVQAAKLPTGVELPKVEPKFQAPFLGFTKTAEIWNSRVCMIGLIGIFIVELILNKGILQLIGVEVGKGLNLPL